MQNMKVNLNEGVFLQYEASNHTNASHGRQPCLLKLNRVVEGLSRLEKLISSLFDGADLHDFFEASLGLEPNVGCERDVAF